MWSGKKERKNMGLDLWFQEDVARILASTYETMRVSTDATATCTEFVEVYRQGFADALHAVEIAFGLIQPSRPVDRTLTQNTPTIEAGRRSACHPTRPQSWDSSREK
jgi:hypothetical protein